MTAELSGATGPATQSATTGRVAGKVALITGAARGQGRAHAVRLAAEGADIVAVDSCAPISSVHYEMPTEDDLAETRRLVEASGCRALAAIADVRSSAQLDSAVSVALSTFGRIDIVCANAGIFTFGQAPGSEPRGGLPSHEIDEAAWDEMIAINLSGQWRTVRAALPAMIDAASGGSIIFTASTAAQKGVPYLSHYSASKFGVIGLMQSLSNELGRHGIRVNAVCPTSVATPMTRNDHVFRMFRPDLEAPTFEDAARSFMAHHSLPVAQIEADDVTEAVLYLASDAARYVTGIALPVDAGARVMFGVNQQYLH